MKGNRTRHSAAFKAQGDILERNAYYPFGLQMNQGKAYPTLTQRLPQLYSGYISSTPARRDIYNGKELQTAAGTDYIDYGFRQYDPVTARWMAVDPKSEKYLALAPYNYCLNNSIQLIDLFGDKIAVRDYQDKYFYTYFYNPESGVFEDENEIAYSGNNQDIIELTKALNMIYSGENGSLLIAYLYLNPKEVLIEIKHDGKCFEQEGIDKGSMIRWNPDDLISINNRSENYITLTHELAHSRDRLSNNLNYKIWYSTSTEKEEYKEVSRSEISALHTENKIRSEHNIELRAFYDPNDERSQVIINGNESLFYYEGAYSRKKLKRIRDKNAKRFKY